MNTSHLKNIIDFRRELHQFPEISGREEQTARRVGRFLSEHTSANVIDGIGGHGVMAIFEPDPVDDPITILVRAELDALPIHETGNRAHISGNSGTAHSCGHDGHTAILCALGMKLSGNPAKNRVILLFQPAEETGEGAAAVLADPAFLEYRPDQVLALHNIPGEELGTVLWRSGVFCAASVGMHIRFRGQTAHSAYPATGVSPVPASLSMVEYARATSGKKSDADFWITLAGLQTGGDQFGISPGDAELWFTLRALETSVLNDIRARMQAEAERLAAEFSLDCEISWHEPFDATYNDAGLTQAFVEIMHQNGYSAQQKQEPFLWSEDFGRFTSAYRGFLFGLGSGLDCKPLHNPAYDFPDELIPVGAGIFEAWIRAQETHPHLP